MTVYHAHFYWNILKNATVGPCVMFIECKIDTVYGEYPFLNADYS